MYCRLADIQLALASHPPQIADDTGHREAAVAMLLRERQDCAELLFIERAQHPDDPWSGHIAFPGGRREAEDPDLHAVACREVLEEVAINLDRATLVGRLDDLPGRHGGRDIGLNVSCLVYAAPHKIHPRPNYEVSRIFWTPLSWLAATENQTTLQMPFSKQSFPGIRLENGAILWGLTYRFVSNLLRIGGLK